MHLPVRRERQVQRPERAADHHHAVLAEAAVSPPRIERLDGEQRVARQVGDRRGEVPRPARRARSAGRCGSRANGQMRKGQAGAREVGAAQRADLRGRRGRECRRGARRSRRASSAATADGRVDHRRGRPGDDLGGLRQRVGAEVRIADGVEDDRVLGAAGGPDRGLRRRATVTAKTVSSSSARVGMLPPFAETSSSSGTGGPAPR